MNTTHSFVTTIELSLAKKLRIDLQNQGFELSTPPYTVFSAKKKGVSCTLYQSGKLMVQGKDMAAFLEFYLEPEILKSFSYTYQDADLDLTPRIGIDESGKGDFFGPLCIAGVYAQGKEIAKLKKLGVKDSKALSDKTIISLAKSIQSEFVHQAVRISPAKYNEIYGQFGNLNRLLAWGHATAIAQLVERTGCKNVTIDQFANESVVLTALKRKKLDIPIIQRHRAEEDVVVAAASIVARSQFLEGLRLLAEEFGIILPKGASAQTIQAGKDFVRRYGKEELAKVAKLHFKTLDSILGKTSSSEGV